MTHIAIPENVWTAAMDLLGTIPAHQSRAVMNSMEKDGRKVTISAPADEGAGEIEGEIVTKEERDALLQK